MSDKIKFCIYCGGNLKKARKNKFLYFRCIPNKHIFYPKPSPAVAVLIVKNKQILLAKRGIQPYFGRWTLPSGFVEYGEEPEEALSRELNEEIGIIPTKYYLFGAGLGKDNPKTQVLQLYYVVTSYRNKPTLASKENLEISWFELSKMPKIAFKNNRFAVKKFIAEKVMGNRIR